MLVLTPSQERFILKQLESCEPFDNGASRVCFECPTEIVKFLGLNAEYEYIIKLAMGLGGLSQNQLEILTYQQYGESHPLAQIFAAGRYVEIMEKLEIEYDFRDFVDEDCYFCEDDRGEEYWGFNEEIASQVQVAVELLSDLFGQTNDNGQIGYSNLSGTYVSYDYGFTTEKYRDDQMSDLSNYIIYDEGNLRNYLRGLSDILEQEDELLGSVEKALLDKCENYTGDEDAEYEDDAEKN